MKRSPMKRSGKKTKAWDRVRSKLKVEFQAKNITTCEVMFEGCTGGYNVSFAHARKRTKLREGEIRDCCIACQSCHRHLDEDLSHDDMYSTVMGIIERRNA